MIFYIKTIDWRIADLSALPTDALEDVELDLDDSNDSTPEE